MARGADARKRIIRTAAVAVITFTVTMAIAGVALYLQAVTSLSAPAKPATAAEEPARAPAKPAREPKNVTWPAREAVRRAERIARSRDGVVSFAAIGESGLVAGSEPGRQFYSASVSKAMLLVAELRRLRREGIPLDSTTRSTLERMVTLSDNDAADAIYARVGDQGLNEVAGITGMSGFAGDVGHWSNVRITAGDLALFMSKLDELLDLPYGGAGSEMLASVTPSQAWGIPQAAPEGARVRFKGGWRPADTGQLVHQAARVDIDGESYALAVLTDGNPSQAYGQETIRLIAAELLEAPGRVGSHESRSVEPERERAVRRLRRPSRA